MEFSGHVHTEVGAVPHHEPPSDDHFADVGRACREDERLNRVIRRCPREADSVEADRDEVRQGLGRDPAGLGPSDAFAAISGRGAEELPRPATKPTFTSS